MHHVARQALMCTCINFLSCASKHACSDSRICHFPVLQCTPVLAIQACCDKGQQLGLHTLVQVTACMAAAVVHLAQLPPRLNQLIQPLMASLRKEPQPPFQRVAAQALARLMLLCIARQPCPNDRVIKNACALACQEAALTASPQDGNAPGSDSASQSAAAKVSPARSDTLELHAAEIQLLAKAALGIAAQVEQFHAGQDETTGRSSLEHALLECKSLLNISDACRAHAPFCNP